MKKQAIIFISSAAVVAAVICGAIQFLRAHQVQNASAWENRLRLIDGAKNEWALEHNMQTNHVPTWTDISEYMYQPSNLFRGFSYTNGRLVNSNGEAYTIGRVDELPVCYKDGKMLKLQ